MVTRDPVRTLHLTYRVDVSPARVFEAWTNPATMRKWMYAEQDTEYKVNLKPGGRWAIVNRRDGEEYTATGVYLEVTPPTRLVYTYSMPQFSPNSDTIMLELTADGDGCLIQFDQGGVDIADELAALKDGEVSASERGWMEGFRALEAALT